MGAHTTSEIASTLTHLLRSRVCALALLLVHRFYQTPAVASVWIDVPERDQEKWSSGFPVKSRDQQRTESGHRTMVFRRGNDSAPERDQEKWPSGFPAKSRDRQRIWSGHRTVELPPEVIPLQSAIRKSGLPVFL